MMDIKFIFRDPEFRPMLFRTVRDVIREEVDKQVSRQVDSQVKEKLKYRLPCEIDKVLRNKLPGEIEAYVRNHEKVEAIVKSTEARVQHRANVVLNNVANDKKHHNLIFGPFIQSQTLQHNRMMQAQKQQNDQMMQQSKRDMEEDVRQLRNTNSLLSFGCVMLDVWIFEFFRYKIYSYVS
jgi:hypothetical protein